MNRTAVFLTFTLLAASTAAGAAQTQPQSPELRKLDVSVGRWVFHGKSLDTPFSQAGKWTWREDCRWSPNGLFLTCAFDNVWSGKAVRSLVVDTWNSRDGTYWHYEFFAAGAGGAKPFVSRMTIHGDTWVEHGTDKNHGRTVQERIVYRFASSRRVRVTIEVSRDGKHWTTTARGVGVKRPRGAAVPASGSRPQASGSRATTSAGSSATGSSRKPRSRHTASIGVFARSTSPKISLTPMRRP